MFESVFSCLSVRPSNHCVYLKCVSDSQFRSFPYLLFLPLFNSQLCAALAVAIRSPAADTRKCAVFCFVEMFLHVRDALTPLLQVRDSSRAYKRFKCLLHSSCTLYPSCIVCQACLSPNELRLVTIYVTKSLDARATTAARQ